MYVKMLVLFLANFIISFVCACPFNIKYLTEIIPENTGNRYFGYSVLLQKGDNPIVIVGAPKDRFVNTKHYGGEVFQCNIHGNKKCQSIFPTNSDLYKSPNGDFLGATLEGDDHNNGLVMGCAPRTPVQLEGSPKRTYLYGKCIFRKNPASATYSIEVNKITEGFPMKYSVNGTYYLYGYGLLGFALSIFNKDYVLCSVPRYAYAGTTLLLPMSSFEKTDIPDNNIAVNVLPHYTSKPNATYQDIYFGYSVNAAKNLQSNETWLIAGAPRANTLRGLVILYKYVGNKTTTGIDLIRRFLGDKFGSFYGASVLLVDVTNDRFLDVIVGAPLAAGKTYDEGCVYFYRSSANTYNEGKQLTGSNKIASRFGTSISSLGDIDLDGFNDVAISAPYEENGDGAVYIYKGSADGLENLYSQRLSPTSFKPVLNVKGFGQGISRGNDVDKDGHNDIAIGAYKSDKVFIIPSCAIVELHAELKPTINAIQENTTAFDLELNIKYTKRSVELNAPSLQFKVNLNLDYRSVERAKTENVTVHLGATTILTYRIKIKPIETDIYPFVINAKIVLNSDRNIKLQEERTLERTIPYAIGCNDNFCITGLSIQVKTNGKKITLGVDHQLDIEVSVNNDGDPAFQCMLIIQAPIFVQLGTIYDCERSDKNYSCPFSEKIGTNMTKRGTYIFDLKDLNTSQLLQINISAVSFGVNKNSYRNTYLLEIPVITNTTSYIVGRSLPGTLEVARTPDVNDTEIISRFTIEKSGPSPLKINVTLLVPVVEYNGESIFKLEQVQGINLVCKPLWAQPAISRDEILKQNGLQEVLTNNSILIFCRNETDCDQYRCEGWLETVNQLAVIEIRLMVISRLLVPKYRHELRKTNLIVYLPVAVQHSSEYSENRLHEAAPIFVFVQYTKYAPLWIFILGAVLGFMALMIIIIGLYRRGFFDRQYKDLMEEQLIQNARAEQDCCNLDVSEARLTSTHAIENIYLDIQM